MRKKIKLIFLSIGLSIALIAGIIELGKILNVVSTQETSQGFKETVVTASPQWPKEHTEGSLGGAPCGQMYNFAPGYYCARHEWEIARHKSHNASTTVISDPAGNGRAQEITYEYDKTTEMTQSIAYAQNYELGGKTDDWTMQRIIWGSWQFEAYTGNDCGLLEEVKQDGTWTTESNGMIGRSYQFANFVYKALDENGNLGLTFTPLADEDDSLRIMVDQNALKYTVGPYVLNFKNQNEGCVEGTGDELMKDLVYNEIIEKNKGWTEDNAFCKGKIQALITYEDNTHELKEIGVEVLDSAGNPIPDNFPKFGETFYLRYKTTLDEDIRYIRPSIQISHLKKMTDKGRNYEVWTYKSKHIRYSMITDQGDLLVTALRDAMYKLGYFKPLVYDMRAEVISGHWEIRSLQHEKWNIMSCLTLTSPGSEIDRIISALVEKAEDTIRINGDDWGLGDLDPHIDYVGCFYWLGSYHENVSCRIVSKCIWKEWKKQKEDPLTKEKIDEYDYYTESSSDGNFTGPTGDGWSLNQAKCEAWVSDPLRGMENVRLQSTDGPDEENGKSAEEVATKAAQQAVQDWIDSQGGLTIGFKINNVIIDEDILESQPNERIEDVVPPEEWHDKEITIEEMRSHWHISEGGGYSKGSKERFSGSMVEEEQDYAVEVANLPRKRNQYVFRSAMYGKICRRLSLENLLE